jgi:DNA polymerase III epsilon subunit-like protein
MILQSPVEPIKKKIIHNIAIDLETSGLNFLMDQIMEIGAVVTDDNGKLIDTFQSYVFWEEDQVNYNAEAFVGNGGNYPGNGITYDKVRFAPTINGVIERFAEFLQRYCVGPEKQDGNTEYIGRLVFHNASFDKPFLECDFRAYLEQFSDDELPNPAVHLGYFRRVLDTVSMAYCLLQENTTLSQEKLGKILGNENKQPHSALADAIQLSHNFHSLRNKMIIKANKSFINTHNATHNDLTLVKSPNEGPSIADDGTYQFSDIYARAARLQARVTELEICVAGLEAAIGRVKALHYPQNNGVEMACYECGSPWPCPTILAVSAETSGE